MMPLIHLGIAIILAVILMPFYGLNVYFIIIGGVIIDIDHIIFYYLKFRNLNLAKSYSYFSNKKNFKTFKGIFFLFHNFEFLIMMVILSFFNKIILLITIGVISHFILDFIFEIKTEKNLIKNYSVIYGIIKKIR